jgi:hypothetical protein
VTSDLRDAILALALAAPDLDAGPADLAISRHAVRRYQERVEAVPGRLAARRLQQLATTARWRRRPRPGWGTVLHDGTVYGYSERRPELCLVARDGVLRTVLTLRIPAPRRAEP